MLHAKILLKADEGLTDVKIGEHLGVGIRTIERVRLRCGTEGLSAALNPKKRPPQRPKIDGEASARLVIEVDGGQHYGKVGAAQDAARDRYLESLGLEVLRFSNLDVLRNTDAVIAAIVQHLDAALGQKNTKSPQPPFSKGE